jgi:hypothetical protein
MRGNLAAGRPIDHRFGPPASAGNSPRITATLSSRMWKRLSLHTGRMTGGRKRGAHVKYLKWLRSLAEAAMARILIAVESWDKNLRMKPSISRPFSRGDLSA